MSVVQPGARLHYAVPRIFAEAGLLRCLYTDIHAEHRLLRMLDGVLPYGARPKAVRRLLGRRLPPGVAVAQVRDLPVRSLVLAFGERLGLLKNSMDSLSSALLVALESETYGADDVIYTVLVNEDAAAMTRLRNRGARVIHECMLGPDVGLWICDEAKLYPGLEDVAPRTEVDAGRQHDLVKLATADLVLAPSEFTRSAILDLAGASKLVSVVPYGLDLDRFDTRNVRPEPGRIVMIGTVGLRKGSHHFASASRELKRRGVPTSCRVAGPIPNTVRKHSTFQGPTYLGQVPRSQIGHEFQLADIFVLPTLAEGFPLAHLEALAHGVPVITTPNCGSVVRNGVEGFIVPIRDPIAIADRIEEIVTDRNLRNRMSVAARARAGEFTIEKYAERLINAVQLIA